MDQQLLFAFVFCLLLLEATNALKFPSLRRLLAANPLLARPKRAPVARPLTIDHLKPKRAPLIVEPPLEMLTYATRSLQTSQKPKVLFVLGGPGAGKGTQCTNLSAEFGMSHISAGDLLREEMASGSPLGNEIAGYIKEGAIVPVRVTVELLRTKIFAMETTANRVLIDGFPRNQDNLEGEPFLLPCFPPCHLPSSHLPSLPHPLLSPLLPSILSFALCFPPCYLPSPISLKRANTLVYYFLFKGWNELMNDIVDLEGVVFIDCPEEEMLKRLLSRGLTSGRTDDNIETAKKRFATYHAATMPVVNHFEREQKLLRIGRP